MLIQNDLYANLWNKFNAHFVSLSGFPIKTDLCRKLWPDKVKDAIQSAELLLNDTFLFQHPWDMEQTAVPYRFEKDINWKHSFNGDEEFVYQMNRHQYWVTLGQAYQLTGDERYAQCFVRQILDWIQTEPLCDEALTQTWRTLEAGVRAVNWCQAMALFAKSPSITSDVIVPFFKSLSDHGFRLFHNPRTKFSLKSNWGFLEYTGLYLLGFVLENSEWISIAKDFLKQCLRIQILDDGMQWEASPMYHNVVLITLLEALRIAKIYNDTLFDETEIAIINKMAWVNVSLKNPDNCQPMTGDSDNTDVRDVITRSALQFNDGKLKYAGLDTLDFDSIWLYDWKSVFIYRKIKPIPVPTGLFHLIASGQIVMRSGWDRDSFWLYFTNGHTGGGHGHSDKLHLSLWIGGDEILVDSGRYTYTNVPLRRELKNAVSHNVPLVDKEEFAAATGPWGFSALPISLPNQAIQKGPYTFIEGSHTGYCQKGIIVNRRILVLDHKVVVICDAFIGPKPNSITQRFHFGEHISLLEKDMTVHGYGKSAYFQLFSFANGCNALPKLEQGPFSGHYNQLSTIPVTNLTVSDAFTLTSIIVQSNKKDVAVKSIPVINLGTGKNITSNQGEGYSIQVDDRRFGLILMHQDSGNGIELLGIADKYGVGRTMVCDLDSDTTNMFVLQE